MASESDLRRLGRAAGLSAREVARYQELDLFIVPEGEPGEALLGRLRRIRRLRSDLGLAPDAVAIVLRLIDRLEAPARPRPVTRWSVRVVDGPPRHGR
jgi:hypothetical protein